MLKAKQNTSQHILKVMHENSARSQCKYDI